MSECAQKGVKKWVKKWSKNGSFLGYPQKLSYNRRSTFFTKNHFFAFFGLFFSFALLGRWVKIRTPFLHPFLLFFDSQKRGHFSPDKLAKNDVKKCHFFHVFILAEKKWSKNGHFKSDQKVSKSALYTPIHPDGVDPKKGCSGGPLFEGSKRLRLMILGQNAPFWGSKMTPF